MSKKYKNSPIIEAVCEFIFTDGTKWDLTIPGLVYEAVRTKFPNKEQHLHQLINISTELPSDRVKSQIRRNEIAVFLTPDKKMSIQVGPHTLSINRLKPYTSWDDLKSHIEYAFGVLSNKVEIEGLQRIGLRYINRIEIPHKSYNLEKYFQFRPFLGDNLPEVADSFILGCAFSFYGAQDTCKVQLTDAIPEKSGVDSSAFILDLDYFLARPKTIEAKNALEWVDRAHTNIESLFEGCISEPLRQIFEEIE